MMTQKISRVFRATFGLVLISLWILFGVVVHVWILFSNYSGVVQSLELLGYDQKPLGDNRLFGWLFESILLGNATLCELYAGGLVLAMALSLAISCHLIAQLITHIRDYKIFLIAGDTESAANIKLNICWGVLPWLFLYIPLAFLISLWDFQLFYYRAFSGVLGIEDAEAAVSMESAGLLVKQYGESFSIGLTQLSAVGYISIVIAIALFIAYLATKFSERWELLVNAVAGLFALDGPNPQQVTTPQTHDSTTEEQGQSAQESTNDDSIPIPLGEVSDGGDFTADTTAIQQTQFSIDEEVEVIGSSNKRINRLQAIKDTKLYYVDAEGKVWDRGYYDSIVKVQ